MISTEFFITSLVVVLMPGAGVLYTVTTGLALRTRAGIAAAIGCTLGILPHMFACILGLSAILHLSAQVFLLIRLAGSLYLLYLVWSMWRDSGSIAFKTRPQEKNDVKIIIKGILINLLNPKLTVFFFAFLPLFITTAGESQIVQMIRLSVVFIVMTLVIFILYGILASAVSTYLTGSSKVFLWIKRSFAVIFAALALKLVVTEN